MSGTPALRLLMSCTSCGLQHDASALEQGAKFHCACGEVLTAQAGEPHEAAVVRCSSCGAPRETELAACRFCGSDFTLHEQDLHTICPNCATRISDRARFCHSCATPISPQQVAGEKTAYDCPACSQAQYLTSRPADGENVALLECPRCAGIWIGHDVFRHFEEKALTREIGWNPMRSEAAASSFELPPFDAPLYRRCPVCEQLMNRRNYGRRSGVIVDMCLDHGIWFDSGELAGILEWIREGNWTGAKRQKILEDAEMTAARRTAAASVGRGSMAPAYGGAPATLGRLIVSVLEAFFLR